MAGKFNNYSRSAKKPEKNIGKGVLEKVTTAGPHSKWVGMPPYYIHTLTVEGTDYTYLTGDKELEIPVGEMVTFRYQEYKTGLSIDKRSLGIVIDPSTLSS